MTLDIPERIYHAGLVAIFAIVTGLVFVFASNQLAPPAPGTPADAQDLLQKIDNLKAESEQFREQNLRLLGIIAQLDPDQDCLVGTIYDPAIKDRVLPDESR